jgi:SRSO17 transposase
MSQKPNQIETSEKGSLFDKERWGLPTEAVADLADRLHRVWERFRNCLTTKTRDTSKYAKVYLRGLLTMDAKRNYANIARRVIDPADDGQNLQHFMSDSPWKGRSIFTQIQTEIQQRPDFNAGLLTLDESGDKRSGTESAGVSRQYIGRMGKVDTGQVGVALGYYQSGVWAMVDAELYLPEIWFEKEGAELQKRWHIPKDRVFATKTELGLEMIARARANGLPFEVVTCDNWYGRDSSFRAELATLGEIYLADIPANTSVYLNRPIVGVPQTPIGKRGRPFKRLKVLNQVRPIPVRALVSEVPLKMVPVRETERGWLRYTCAALSVWTVTEEGTVHQETLFIWRKPDGHFSFSLTNAPVGTPLKKLAYWRSGRYFVERTFQDAKTECGWDELVARKYRAFLHHTALDALALWFMAETKLDFLALYPRDESLMEQLELSQLPGLSIANIRELLKAVLPLKQLTKEQATALVVKHLVARASATRCRTKQQQRDCQQGRAP